MKIKKLVPVWSPGRNKDVVDSFSSVNILYEYNCTLWVMVYTAGDVQLHEIILLIVINMIVCDSCPSSLELSYVWCWIFWVKYICRCKKVPVLKKIQDSQKRSLLSSFTSWLSISLIKIQWLFVFIFVLLSSLFFYSNFFFAFHYLKIVYIYIYILSIVRG